MHITKFSPSVGMLHGHASPERNTVNVRPPSASRLAQPPEQTMCQPLDVEQAGTSFQVAGHNAMGNPGGLSTLHIDGSALGRWAISHIERALTKPSAGISSVDARMISPQSRISPF
jgi:hypothetical protein